MSGNTLTVVSAVAGIIVGFVTSWWFARSGMRHVEAERELIAKNFSALQGLTSGVLESITTVASMMGTDGQHGAQTAVVAEVADHVLTAPGSPAESSAIDVVVRASLGSLLNEHGEVGVPRLLREVTRALPEVGLSSVLSSLEKLRNAGRISWSGDDVRRAEVIRVHPQ